MERTLVLVKPDGVSLNLTGKILSRLEDRYKLEFLKTVAADRELLFQHYVEHIGKPFFDSLLDFMSSGLLVVSVFSGDDIVCGVRELFGATDPWEAEDGTIRGDYGRSLGGSVQRNIVHGSDSVVSAEREIALWFGSEVS